jgi:hypothetical protein
LGKIELRRQEDMKMFVALVALLALVGSAMAWDITEDLQYTLVKSAFEQGDYTTVLPQIIGTTSGAYVKEPNVVYGDVWGQVDNTLGTVTVDRSNDWGNPYYTADGNNFYTTLTQGGSASMAISAKDTISKDPEISGSASAFQNLWVGGEFAETTASFDSRAIIGFSDIQAAGINDIETAKHFVVTDVDEATASVDASAHGAGLFNTANMGVQVDADIEQNYVGSGWASPTYSGGITMWANFAGACDPYCANPIMTTVDGSAGTSIFPANIGDLAVADGANNYGIGDAYYWGNNFGTNPVLQNV